MGLKEDFSETKPWYFTRGVIGPAVSIVLGLASAKLGYEFTRDDEEAITLALVGLGTAVFSAIGVWGRIKAKKKVTLKKEKTDEVK